MRYSELSGGAVSQRTRLALIILTASALLGACGGGGDNGTSTKTTGNNNTDTTTAPILPAGKMAQVTGLAPGIVKTGTYELNNCTDSGGAAFTVNPNLRISEDGSLTILAADGNTLHSLVPSDEKVSARYIYVSPGEAFPSQLTIQLQEIGSNGFETTIDVRPNAVTVFSRDTNNPGSVISLLFQCTTASGGSSPVVNIPIVLTETTLSSRLVSAVALNGGSALSFTDPIDLNTASLSVSGAIKTTQSSASEVTWVNWLAAASGYYEEQYYSNSYFNTNPASTLDPSDPDIYAGFYNGTLVPNNNSVSTLYLNRTRNANLSNGNGLVNLSNQ